MPRSYCQERLVRVITGDQILPYLLLSLLHLPVLSQARLGQTYGWSVQGRLDLLNKSNSIYSTFTGNIVQLPCPSLTSDNYCYIQFVRTSLYITVITSRLFVFSFTAVSLLRLNNLPLELRQAQGMRLKPSLFYFSHSLSPIIHVWQRHYYTTGCCRQATPRSK